jgi:hypothetical protein
MADAIRRFLSLGALASLTVSLPAQQPRARAGFWWGLGVGYGSWHFTADSAAQRRGDRGIGQGYLAGGVSIDRHWSAGIELGLGAISGAGAGMSSQSLIVTWHPWDARGWFARAGIGRSGYRESSGAEGPDYKGSGTGYVAALGIDLGTTGGLALTPMITFRSGVIGRVGLGLPGADLAVGFRQRTVGVTLGLTFP